MYVCTYIYIRFYLLKFLFRRLLSQILTFAKERPEEAASEAKKVSQNFYGGHDTLAVAGPHHWKAPFRRKPPSCHLVAVAATATSFACALIKKVATHTNAYTRRK